MLLIILIAIIITGYNPVQSAFIDQPTIAKNFTDNVTSEVGILKHQLIDKVGSSSDSGSAEEEAVIEIIYKRPHILRKLIEDEFNLLYGNFNTDSGDIKKLSLQDRLHQVLNGDKIRELIPMTFKSPQGLLATIVHDTIDGTRNDFPAVEEVICANDNVMKSFIQEYYLTNYKQTLEEHFARIYKVDNPDYQQVVMQFCWPNRAPELLITEEIATKEVEALRAIDAKQNKDAFKNKLREIMPLYTEGDLQFIFQKYRNDKYGIDSAVNDAFDNADEKRAYSVLVRYIEDTCKYYADELHSSVEKGVFKTDVPKMNRIVLTRCERDLGCINEAHKKNHGKSFYKRLKTDIWTDRDFLEAMKCLLGEK